MELLDIMEEFPLLSSWKENTYFTGFISSQTLLIRIAIEVPNFPRTTGISLKGNSDSLTLFESHQADVEQLSSAEMSFIDFLRGLQSIINKHHDKNQRSSISSSAIGINTTNFCVAVFNELEQIGPSKVEYLSKNFQEVSIRHHDDMKRKHIVKFIIPPQYPNVPVKVVAELPSTLESIQWPHNLMDAFNKFQIEAEKYTLLWSTLDELDSQSRVVDPIQPRRSDCHRRIMMNHNIVVNLVVNPLSPCTFPEIHFSGPEKTVKALESLLDKHCQSWNENRPILDNLKDILECEFMPKEDEDGDANSLENTCVICCAFEFEGKIPETTCNCGSIYHDKCLSDLLVSDCAVKAKRLCVDCPVCGMELKVSKAKTATW